MHACTDIIIFCMFNDNMHIIIAISIFYLVNRISFDQSVYIVNERDEEEVEIVLLLTNKSSVDITVQVATEDSTSGELYYNKLMYVCKCISACNLWTQISVISMGHV